MSLDYVESTLDLGPVTVDGGFRPTMPLTSKPDRLLSAKASGIHVLPETYVLADRDSGTRLPGGGATAAAQAHDRLRDLDAWTRERTVVRLACETA